MFLRLLVSTLLHQVICGEGTEKSRPLVLPVPLELPTRNDRASQCWLRIEDLEVTETIAVYCTLVHAFYSFYIHDYNIRKMTEDAVSVSIWFEKPSGEKDAAYGPPNADNGLIDWKLTTVFDPITKSRVYVTKDADCRLIMYTREAISNFKVDCPTILYFMNEHYSGSEPRAQSPRLLVLFLYVFLIYYIL